MYLKMEDLLIFTSEISSASVLDLFLYHLHQVTLTDPPPAATNPYPS